MHKNYHLHSGPRQLSSSASLTSLSNLGLKARQTLLKLICCSVPLFQQLGAEMDKILEAVVMSSYPNNVKQGLVRRVIEAAKQPMDSEQCWSMLELSTKLYLTGDTKYKREIGKEVLEVYGHYHPEEFEEFFNVRFLLSLLQEGYGPLGKRSHYVLDYIQLGLQFVLESPSANSIFSLLRIEVLRKVCERPSPKQCAKISKLLTQHPQCIPTGKHQVLFCQQLIRCIGQFQCISEGEEDIMEFLEQVNKVSGLLQRIWRTQTSAILPSLKELFTIISSTGNLKKKKVWECKCWL